MRDLQPVDAMLWPQRRRWALGLAGLLLSVGVVAAPSAPPAAMLDETKAAHLQRFASFVEWPSTRFELPDSPIVVGVAGAPQLQRAMALLTAGRQVQGRALYVTELSDPRQVASVHMLMIGRDAWTSAHHWVAAAQGRSVLVVTDMPDGIKVGAALCLLGTDSQPRFLASLPAAEAAGVRLSSRLLLLAERVVKSSP